MKRLLALLLLLLLPLSGVTAPRSGDSEKSTGAEPYVALEPFVLNVQDVGRVRFMQVKVQIMSSDVRVRDILKENMPPLRDALIMLLAHQNAETVQEMFAKVTNADPKAPAPATPPIEALYFTDFIIQ